MSTTTKKIIKPENIDEYKKWLKQEFQVVIDRRVQSDYESVGLTLKENLSKSSMWMTLENDYRTIDHDYLTRTGYHLFFQTEFPELKIKPFRSFLLKSFRKNVLENSVWPNKPGDGWVLPENWLKATNDIVRTSFAVKYLDGVEYLIGELSKRSEDKGYHNKVDYEAKDVGYYAAHFYFFFPCNVPGIDWETDMKGFSVEIQVTTQVQDVIKKLLHKYYNESRQVMHEEDVKWQWDYRSDEFSVNYLGHILHYLEGMIMEIREKQEKQEK